MYRACDNYDVGIKLGGALLEQRDSPDGRHPTEEAELYGCCQAKDDLLLS